jgi:hypothetical protein
VVRQTENVFLSGMNNVAPLLLRRETIFRGVE